MPASGSSKLAWAQAGGHPPQRPGLGDLPSSVAEPSRGGVGSREPGPVGKWEQGRVSLLQNPTQRSREPAGVGSVAFAHGVKCPVPSPPRRETFLSPPRPAGLDPAVAGYCPDQAVSPHPQARPPAPAATSLGRTAWGQRGGAQGRAEGPGTRVGSLQSPGRGWGDIRVRGVQG